MERQRVLPLLQVDPCSFHICHYNGSLTDELLVALLRPVPVAGPGGWWGVSSMVTANAQCFKLLYNYLNWRSIR